MTDQGAATGYAYALPAHWVHLDVEPSRRAASVRRAVRERVRRDRRLARHLAHLDRLLTHECAVAAAGGAERVSLFAEAVPGAGVVTATAAFAVSELAATPALDAAGVLARLAPVHERARRHDPQARLQLVPGAQQPVVVRSWREAAPVGSGEPVPLLVHQLLAPWPGRPAVGLLTMSSPSRGVWPQLERLFDACRATFHWTWAAPVAEPGRDG